MFVLMKHSNRFSAVVFMLLLYGCGGGGGGTAVTTPSAGPQTTTFMGSARTAANGGCSGNTTSHVVNSGEGTLTVTLTQAGAARMQLQVCATTELDHRNCTVPPFVLLPVGQSVSAAVKGGRSQAVTLFTEGCGAAGATPTDPITYSVSVVHPG
jgi:hypothetical protein